MPEVYYGITKDGSKFVMGYDPSMGFCAIVVNKKDCYSRSFKNDVEWRKFRDDLQLMTLL
jgi:hypothetical protein